jgi:hypothetical protein
MTYIAIKDAYLFRAFEHGSWMLFVFDTPAMNLGM